MLLLASHSPLAHPLSALGLALVPDLIWLVGLVAVLVIVLFVRRSNDDPALRRGEHFTLWRDANETFWGRLEPHGHGLVLHFERSYAPPGEPRRSALVLDGRDACRSLALVRPAHASDRDPRTTGAQGPHNVVGAFVASTLEALELRLERALRSGRPVPLQERACLERWRGKRVVVELENGARLAGRLTHVGPAWLRLVDDGAGATQSHVEILPTVGDAGSESRARAPFDMRVHADSVELMASDDVCGVAHVLDVAGDARTWSLGVTLLPRTRLVLPWAGAGSSAVSARAEIGFGLELLVPRATARVVFATDEDEQEHRRAHDNESRPETSTER